ncbi:protein PIH1D3 [Exaiptasia diaphana]|uniref:PIH1D1/2/3 CS-like domain-containing protein n=1 Tax=Exaiptasia diaphana TaxID=2652724 RepID=A0A913X2W3_EXADI|nr:protein PIH1D3 [Exaiptasia diaphana]KXJ15827.1 Protein PIH1D3 [Exaiptasia diaphana]
MASTFNQLSALSELLKPKDGVEDNSDDDLDKLSKKPSLNPGNIGPEKQTKSDQVNKSKNIWDIDEVADSAHDADAYDTRLEPQYEILFKQAVTSEDMYLQMSNRNPSTASCEDIVIKIQLPNTNYTDVELDVTDKFLDCRTPKFKLGLHLPHSVDSANGKAQWDKEKQFLTVTLRLIRELDFLYS